MTRRVNALLGLSLIGVWACAAQPSARPAQQQGRAAPTTNGWQTAASSPARPSPTQPGVSSFQATSGPNQCAGCAFRRVQYGQACSGIDANEVGLLCSRTPANANLTTSGSGLPRAAVQACEPDCCTDASPRKSGERECGDCEYALVTYSESTCTPGAATADEVLLCTHEAKHVVRPITNRGLQFRSRVRPCKQSCCPDLTSQRDAPSSSP